ncbi:MAG: dTDP-4-dehydrorhamnose 3,5-epimerase family protein [Bdellovibrionota bacterium]
MKFNATPLDGAFVIEVDAKIDERGSFGRVFCEREYRDHGLHTSFVQANFSFNSKKGTLRGLHFQADPHGEVKVARCTRGRAFYVIVDLRSKSKTHGKWFGVELTAENRKSLYMPVGFAGGFQTLEDDTEIHYLMGEYFHADLARGVRFDDPQLAIKWPLPVSSISDRDKALPLFTVAKL